MLFKTFDCTYLIQNPIIVTNDQSIKKNTELIQSKQSKNSKKLKISLEQECQLLIFSFSGILILILRNL